MKPRRGERFVKKTMTKTVTNPEGVILLGKMPHLSRLKTSGCKKRKSSGFRKLRSRILGKSKSKIEKEKGNGMMELWNDGERQRRVTELHKGGTELHGGEMERCPP